MASDLITGVKTSTGTKQIDFNALANNNHAAQHASGGADPITPAAIGAATGVHEHSAADITSGILEIARGGTGAASAADALSALGVPSMITDTVSQTILNGGYAKIQTGSYVGTGTYGASNPCSLTFIKIHRKKGVF